MNSLKDTKDKVSELEKRIDGLTSVSGLNVYEVKKDFDLEPITDTEMVIDLFTMKGTSVNKQVVIQGEFVFIIPEECNITITIELDGYEIIKEVRTMPVNKTYLNILKAITLTSPTDQKLVMKVKKSGGGLANLKSYDLFLWGCLDANPVERSAIEPKIFGDEIDGEFSLYCILNNALYEYSATSFPQELKFDDFELLGSAKSGSVCYSADETPVLYSLIVDTDGVLKISMGKITTLEEATFETIDTDVSCVASALIKSGELLVAYCKNRSLYVCTVSGTTVGKSVFVYSFDSDIDGVSVMKNCIRTNYVIVSLTDGKNYLFSSVVPANPLSSTRVLFGVDISYSEATVDTGEEATSESVREISEDNPVVVNETLESENITKNVLI